MAEYIKRDDAIHILVECDLMGDVDVCRAMQKVREIPAADVVEVVRCKDCKHYSPTYYSICTNNNVEISFYGESAVLVVDPDFYCAYGERSDDDEA